MAKNKSGSPTRFVLTLVDTRNTFGQGESEQYFNWSVGFDKFDKLREIIPEEKGGGTELDNWLKFIEEQTNKIKKSSKTKGYTMMPTEVE